MTTGSTASSGTEGTEPQVPEGDQEAPAEAGAQVPTPPPDTATPADSEHNAARRAFFFEFGKSAVGAVGQVAGMANIVSRTSSSAAASLLGLEESAPAAPAPAVVRSARSGASPVVSPSTAPAAGDDAFRSPYRLVGDDLVLLDQRAIPEALEEVSAKRGSDVAYYLRLGVVRGGAAMAQVAAYGLALTARERAEQPFVSRDVELRRTRRALAGARPSSRLPAWAMDRMEAVEAGFVDDADGATVAAALLAEAHDIATDFQVQHSAIVAGLIGLMPTPQERPLTVLVHGDSGALAGGLVGTGLSALQTLSQDGRDLRVFVTETRPFMDGARLASWQLRQAGIDHKVVTDSSVSWLFAREPIDVVLLTADWIAMDGDASGVIGSRAIVQQAAAAPLTPDGARPLVIVSAVSATIDAATAHGSDLPVELRPARDMAAYLSDVPIRASDAVVPATDVMPASLIHALVTERGVASPPTASAMAALSGVAGQGDDA